MMKMARTKSTKEAVDEDLLARTRIFWYISRKVRKSSPSIFDNLEETVYLLSILPDGNELLRAECQALIDMIYIIEADMEAEE